MRTLPQRYDTQATESRLQQWWEEQQVYAWDERKTRAENYVIDTPPPTVSGHLHMGHIFSYTQADFIARYQRMKGMNVFYPMGFDDNGLPTERLVEKNKKIQAHRYIQEHGREGFIALCQGVVDDALKDFRALFQSVALSVDWNQQYHTISDDVLRLSQMSFLDLMDKGHVERRLQPMLWDPVDQTAIAQAEVEEKEHPSHMHYIQFSVAGSAESITIATTRPELLPACVAVMLHPEDARYAHLKGKHAITPVFGVKVPFVFDEKVKMDKGSGAVMCCTFGDQTDVDWWKAHDLPIRIILNKYGKIADEVDIPAEQQSNPAAFTNAYSQIARLKARTDARNKVIEMVTEAGKLDKSEPITHMEPCAERSGAPLEILPTPQWFVKVLDKKDALQTRNKECTWYPDWMSKRMEQWIDGLKWDWCISRQRFFGVPFPVWYSKRAGEEGKILLAHPDDLPANPLKDLPRGYSRDEVDADPDVMDTWATSSISPQLNSHALNDKYAVNADRHAKLYPADLRPQAHEIIRTWAFYTLLKAHLHGHSIPWKNLMISGWCLAEDKSKMSKSKGNVVTPTGLIEQSGADAVRYWASTSRLGTDTAFSPDTIKIGAKLVNKLFNASKFASMQFKHILPSADHATSAALQPAATALEDVAAGRITEPLDLWILTRLHRAVAKATEEFETYEYADARVAIEDFFWNDFCDNYLELCKTRAYGEVMKDRPDSEQKQYSAIYTIYHCLETVLRLFAPFVPHVTEDVYQHLFAPHTGLTSLHQRGSWPKAEHYPTHDVAEATGREVVSILSGVRKMKAEQNISIKVPLALLHVQPLKALTNRDIFNTCRFDLMSTAGVDALEMGEAPQLPLQVQTEDGAFALFGTLGQRSEVA